MNFRIHGYFLFMLIIIFSCVSIAFAEKDGMVRLKNDEVSRISQKWHFMPGDSPLYAKPGISMKGWTFRSINDPSPWQEFETLSQEGSIAWYRLDVYVDEVQNLGLLLSHHKRGAQIYLNGTLIHETRPFSPDGSTPPIIGKPVTITLSACGIRKGINCIAIRTASMDNWGGFMNELHIGPEDKINLYWILYLFRYITLASISLFLSMFFAMHYFQRKTEKYYLHYSGLSLGACAWILGFSGLGLFLFDYQLSFIMFSYVGAMCVGIFSIMFIHSFFNIRRGLTANIFIGFYIMHVLALLGEYLFTGSIKYYNRYLYDIFIQSFLLNIIYVLVINISALKKGYDNAKRILAGNLIYALGMVHSILVFLSLLYTDSYVLESFFVMTLFFASSLAARFARLHADLETSHAELLVLDSMKDDFLAMTSHEIRTPLHGIMGIAEMLLNGKNPVKESGHRENISLIMSGLERLNILVREILDFSRLKAGKVDLFMGSVEMDKIILSIVSLMNSIAENSDIMLKTDIDENLPAIIADKKRIEQILINLIGNALKYTEKGEVVVGASAVDDNVLVYVKDTGRGIDKDMVSKIWNPYEQAGNPDTRTAGGTGLGLPITKYLVELHSGAIWVESVTGVGSTFYFQIPVTPTKNHNAITKTSPSGSEKEDTDRLLNTGNAPVAVSDVVPPGAGNNMETILVVDDDSMNLLMLGNFLTEHGYRVLKAGTGPEGMKLIEEQRPHLMILDLMLPGMSGYDVMKQIRDRYLNEFIPVIMVTAKNQTEDMIKGFLFGCNDFLSKPFNLRELLMRVQNQLVLRNILVLEREFSANLAQEKEKLEMSVVDRSRVLRDNVKKLSNWESVIVEDLKFSLTFLEKLMINHVESDSLEYSVHYDPLLQIGGDVYSVYEYREGRVRVFLADATGHGINASLNSITIMTEYNLMRDLDLSPGEIVSRMNNRFCTGLRDYSIIFTCCIADIDLNEGTMVLASAGHPAQFCFTPDGSMHECIPKGPLIGLMDNLKYEEMRIDFPEGSTMVMYTDGLVDEFSESRSYTGEEKRKVRDDKYFRDILRKLHSMDNTETISAEIKTGMKGKYLKLRKDDDDITLIILRRKG